MKKKRVETFRKIYGMVTVVYIIRLSFHLIPCGSRDYALRARYYRAYHYVMMVNELVDDNTVAAPWNDDWRQELHSFLSW